MSNNMCDPCYYKGFLPIPTQSYLSMNSKEFISSIALINSICLAVNSPDYSSSSGKSKFCMLLNNIEKIPLAPRGEFVIK